MIISPKTIAKEWLIFLASYLITFLTIVTIILCKHIPPDSSVFIIPMFFYGFVCFVRSVIWASKTVRQPKKQIGNPSPDISVQQQLRKSEAIVSTTKKHSMILEWFINVTDFSPKVVLWISISLLLFCITVWVFGFASLNWSHLSPEEQGVASEHITNALLKLIVPVAICTIPIKGKLDKLFAASVLLALLTGVGVYWYLSVSH